jgi:hypothetical protein
MEEWKNGMTIKNIIIRSKDAMLASHDWYFRKRKNCGLRKQDEGSSFLSNTDFGLVGYDWQTTHV